MNKVLTCSVVLGASLFGGVYGVMNGVAANHGLLLAALIAAFVVSDRKYWLRPSD